MMNYPIFNSLLDVVGQRGTTWDIQKVPKPLIYNACGECGTCGTQKHTIIYREIYTRLHKMKQGYIFSRVRKNVCKLSHSPTVTRKPLCINACSRGTRVPQCPTMSHSKKVVKRV